MTMVDFIFSFILSFIFLLVSVAFVIISIVLRRKTIKNCSLKIEAVVENFKTHHNYERNHSYRRYIYGYDYNGRHYTAYAKNNKGFNGVGDKLRIMIDPENPDDCYRKEDLLLSNILLILGTFMFCDTIFFFILIITG